MKITDNAINILAAKMYKGIGNAWIVQNIHPHMAVEDIVALLRAKKIDTSFTEFENRKQAIQNRLPNLEKLIDGITAYGDSDFPHIRGKVSDSAKPVLLYYRGDLSLLQPKRKNIAVIGLLNPDKYTINEEEEIVSRLSNFGYCIVSGLALGCDSVAHRQALKSGAKTVAILPSPVQQILPKQNVDLAEDIVRNGGLLISEYGKEALSQMELRGRYDARDRLQVQFSDGVILSASYSQKDKGFDSGSRLAMNYAKLYQLPRYVLYNDERDKNNPKYNLTRELLLEKEERPQALNFDTIYEQLTQNRNSNYFQQSHMQQLTIFD